MAVQALKRRFEELLAQYDDVEKSKRYEANAYVPGEEIDVALFLGWRVKVKNLLQQSCGEESEHYRAFLDTEKSGGYISNFRLAQRLRQVLLAAKEDYEGGYLNSIRNLVHAELFDSELDQARELLTSGYKGAAAVVAGVVLETTLRTLCKDKAIPVGKLDKMNADLAKSGVYNVMIQKRITALADIRNKAAHGDNEAFKDVDVRDMIEQVERFVADHTGS